MRRLSSISPLHKHQKSSAFSDQNRSPLFFEPICQPKLTINHPNDPYEQEADAVADQVMRMEEPSILLKPLPISSVQRKCDPCEKEEKRKAQRKEMNAAETEIVHSLENYTSSLSGAGQALPDEVRSFYEPRFGYDFSDVRVHTDSDAAKSAQSINALAYTFGNSIVFNSGQFPSGTESGKRLMAHELTHIIQQNRSSNQQKIQRQACDSPHDKLVVERAKKRLTILEPQLSALQGQQLAIDAERMRVLDDRKKLDENSDDPFSDLKRTTEQNNMNLLNRKPVSITVTGDSIVFEVNFQVFFHAPAMANQFEILKRTIDAGISLVWNHTLQQGVFSGRKFSVVPRVTLIDSLTKRTDDNWLIEIRSSDKAKVKHPGCSMPEPDPGTPTSVTDTLCDNGVMSIPPSHITNAGVIGHEILHLFGLIDRYMMFIKPVKGGKPKVDLDPLRKTQGRKDPLGAEDGTILYEDLGYIFSEFGVYDQEKQKSAPALALIEREVMRLRKIVETGCDEDSLIRIRKDFRDKILQDAENL